MSTLFNGNKRVKMDINGKAFFSFGFILNTTQILLVYTSLNFRAAEAAKKIQHIELNYSMGIVQCGEI